MIISHEHRYIFVGFPQAGSSTISRELVAYYDGESILRKHTNIPTLCKMNPELDIADYFVFGVYRDPVDMVFTTYNKMRTNVHNSFRDPRFFRENGGYVSKKERRWFGRIHQEGWSFEEYVRHAYGILPFDSDFSISHPFLDQILRFSHLNEDFRGWLEQIGLSPVRDLPAHNVTEKVAGSRELNEALHLRVFGPYLERYGAFSTVPPAVQAGRLNRWRYTTFSKLRTRVRIQFELRRARSVSAG